MIELEPAIKTLVEHKVSFVIIGGLAIVAHGSTYITMVLDFSYARNKDNLKRIVDALGSVNPRPRDFPEDLPFVFDERTLQNATNFTLKTDIGDIDLLGEVAGIGSYEQVEVNSIVMNLYGYDVRVLSIEGLIKAKRAAGRTKDLLVLPELEGLQEFLSPQEE